MREVRIPDLEEPARAIGVIIDHRVNVRAEADIEVANLIDDGALEAFGAFYSETGGNLRHVLAAIAASVEHAAEVGVDCVREPEARYGVTQWRLRQS